LVNQIIHSRFLEFAVAGFAAKRSWTFDFLLQKISDVDAAIFSTNKAAWNAAALDFLAGIAGGVAIVSIGGGSNTFVQCAVE
jgi:hypothetical protein